MEGSNILVSTVLYVVFLITFSPVSGQGGSGNQSTTPVSSTSPSGDQCSSMTGQNCGDCLKLAKCLYCVSNKECKAYPTGNVLPMYSCPKGLDDTRWGVCWVNFKILLIVMGVFGGVILLTLACCCYCCCCKGSSARARRKFAAADLKLSRQTEERKAKSEARRAERQEKYDDIRRKYGLVRDDNPYQRFDA